MKRFLKILSKKGKERSGFTLFELLTVIGIMIILMVIVGAQLPNRAIRIDRGKEGLELLNALRTYYVQESVEGEPPDAPVATDAGLLAWKIDVSGNKRWKRFIGSDATIANTIVFSLPIITITGWQEGWWNRGLNGIRLSINCITGEMIKNYYHPY